MSKFKLLAAQAAFIVTGLAASVNANAALAITEDQINALVNSVDFSTVIPLILAAGAAIIGIVMFKGSIMSVINMLANATRR